jgi:hypothetical protein
MSGGITKLTGRGGSRGDLVSASDIGWCVAPPPPAPKQFRIFGSSHAELLVDSDVVLGGGLFKDDIAPNSTAPCSVTGICCMSGEGATFAACKKRPAAALANSLSGLAGAA